MKRFGVLILVLGLAVGWVVGTARFKRRMCAFEVNMPAVYEAEQAGSLKVKTACCPMDTCTVVKEKTMLWNGRDFSGWKLYVNEEDKDPKDTYSIKDGVIRVVGQPYGYLRTEADYCNYLLHVEWRWPGRGGNSGVFTHMSGPDKMYPKSFECQLETGNAGDIWLIGSGEKLEPLVGIETNEHAAGGQRVEGRRIRKLKGSSEKGMGEWNSYEVICKDDWMLIFANGVLQNVATGMSDCCGKICLQSEGTAIEFRNVYIEPLE